VFSPGHEKDLLNVLAELRKSVPHLFVEFIQRHFLFQKYGIRDGFMEFSLDTLGKPFRKKSSPVKEFPVWFEAVRSAVLTKKGINGQVMFKCRFFFAETRGMDKPEFIETAQNTITALKPLYEYLKG
jgi:hypothetical protein